MICSSCGAYSEISGLSYLSIFKDTETSGLDTISPVLASGSHCLKFSFLTAITQVSDMENDTQPFYETCFRRDIDTVVLTVITSGMLCH